MSFEQNHFVSLLRLDNETNPSYAAFLDYIGMGAGRSLSLLARDYANRTPADPRPPTKQLSTLKEWSSKFNWQTRISSYLRELAEAQVFDTRERLLSLESDAWSDYETARKKVLDMFAQLDQLKTTKRSKPQTDPSDPAKTIQIVTMRANVSELRAAIQAMGDLYANVLLGIGRNRQGQGGSVITVDPAPGAQLALKAYIGFSPDDWPDPDQPPPHQRPPET